MGEIHQQQARPYITDGAWSLYELVEYLLGYSGPANVLLTSFSVSDASIRHLQHLKETQLICRMQGLFDPSLRKTKTALMYFAAEVFDEIRISPNHSKIILLDGSQMKIPVPSPANLGRNRRIEAGMIDSRPQTWDYFNNQLQKIWHHAAIL